MQKFKYSNSIWKIKAVRARLEYYLCVAGKQVWRQAEPGPNANTGVGLEGPVCFGCSFSSQAILHTQTFHIHHCPGGVPSIIPALTSKMNTGEYIQFFFFFFKPTLGTTCVITLFAHCSPQCIGTKA